MMSACYEPGWDKGPANEGAEPGSFMCELDAGHYGDHAWDVNMDGTFAVKWPVTWSVVGFADIEGDDEDGNQHDA